MQKNRLEAFSDGVLAIIITIMVLELKVPHGHEISDLLPIWPVFLSYVLSFIYVGIYWNNHHHMLHASTMVNGRALWANMHLLFWLSLVPFGTAWMGEHGFAPVPVAVYGGILLMAALAYYVLEQTLIHHHGKESLLAKHIGKDSKGLASLVMYAAAIPFAFVHEAVSLTLYVLVAILWFIPDRRIEKNL